MIHQVAEQRDVAGAIMVVVRLGGVTTRVESWKVAGSVDCGLEQEAL
jgi:hypothetical protein